MKVVNLLEFLNKARILRTLDYAGCDESLVNFLDLTTEDEQFTQKIDLGIIFVNQKGVEEYVLVDGLNRILSLSLLLHAVCECYKKTTEQNAKAIKIIRKKYLLSGSGLKLRLKDDDAALYSKIINGERLSGHEKAMPMFVLLHNFWSQIKEEKLQASKIFAMLQKINVTIVETEGIASRDLYYKLNSARNLDQLALVEDYLKENGVKEVWDAIKKHSLRTKNDILAFFRDFFVTKFNFKKFNPDRLYENFVNYFETMKQYMSAKVIISRMAHSAELYYNMVNVNFNNDNLKRAFIEIKKQGGEDTFAYILNVYEDFVDNSISETTFLEILRTITEYLKNRKKSGNNIAFNELINYLNAFIACK